MTTPATLNELRDEALRIAVAHGFTDATIPEDVALMHSELSEALEDHRNGRAPTELYFETKADGSVKPCGIPIEMADVVIRILHFAGKHGIDLDKAVRDKMAFNDSRPFRHGKIL